MKASLLLLAVALSIAPANAAPKAANANVFDPNQRAKVMDPDIRVLAPQKARTYQECKDMLRAQGVGPTYQLGYKA